MPKPEGMSRREALFRGGLLAGAAVTGRAPLAGAGGAEPASGAPELCFKSAVDLARMIREKAVSAREVLEAHLRQIERVNPKVNAIVTLVADEARQAADRADQALRNGAAVGPLHGLPIAVKDLVDTKGIRTTYGSRIYKDHVPTRDELLVERLRGAGAIVLGKSNTPEFGAGSQTFNEVFGETRNPWDLTKTCGGSSGGGAVALACGLAPIADGSDFGGSLRNPPSFCNVFGLRPSPGRVPDWPSGLAWQTLSVSGPMGRSAEDAALLLSALAGPDLRSPIALPEPGDLFRQPLGRNFKGTRIAWSRNLGGRPVEPRVTAVCEGVRNVFTGLGCVVEDGEPDFEGADDIFQTLRAFQYAVGHAEHLQKHRDLLKDTVIWNTEKGLALSGLEVARAEAKRGALYERMRVFMERYDFLVLPVSQVAPFPLEVRWIQEVAGVRMKTYIDWMATCYCITLTGLPAASVPAGFTPEGLPVGLQIVGRHQRDLEVLQMAHAFESATGFGRRRPPVAA
jgi:amidase